MSVPRMSTPPWGVQLELPIGKPLREPSQLELSVPGRGRRSNSVAPLVDGFSSAKRVPAAFFCPEAPITIEMIAGKLGEYRRCSPRQLMQLHEASDLLGEYHEKCPDPETGVKRVRDDSSDYLQHAQRVAYRIAIVGRGRVEDLQQTIAALLHDVVEDFGVRIEDIRRMFGNNVANMVLWLTKPKWDGNTWVYPDSPHYYGTEDKYDHSMYDRRGYSYYRRLYYESGNPSAWVIKAADNLDNLHSLSQVRPEKLRRNVRLIVNNTLAVLSRMLAREDTERLVSYVQDDLHFPVPQDAIAPVAPAWIVSCEPREVLLRRGLEGVYAPRHGQITVYGANTQFLLLLGWLELGLPDDGTDYLGPLRAAFREYTILPEESYLPPGLAASEKIFRVSGFRPECRFRPYGSRYDSETRRVHLTMGETQLFAADLSGVSSISFEEPQLRSLSEYIWARSREFAERLENFRSEYILPSNGNGR
ncbi:MAG: HD domain-containing protein [Candidatus Micrarchaeota archaeon]